MKLPVPPFKTAFSTIVFILFFGNIAPANPLIKNPADTSSGSTFQQALAFINTIKKLDPSPYWPFINSGLFLENLKTNIQQPVSPYQGRGTNFCGYGALSYLLVQEDPLGYIKLLLELYQKGSASYRGILFVPSRPITLAAGKLKFKGVLDIRPAEQMWYLCLADHFKGYLNFFNRKYDPGDEDSFWASVNYAKFNRMIRELLQLKVNARGSDIIHPNVGDLYSYIKDRLKTGKVILYINNRLVHKKDHTKLKLGVPTHFIVLQEIFKVDEVITLVFWDYGGRTLMQLSPAFLRKITFGISHCIKPTGHAL